jgi:cytoskeletal protein CcmA (bactofilin family)
VNIRSKFSDTSFLNGGTGSGTVVAGESAFEGRITSPSLITVAGSVKGELNASEIVIEREGSVKGSIFAEHLIVIGNFEGEVSSNKITIASSGNVKGKLSYKRVTIDDGALLDVSFHKI